MRAFTLLVPLCVVGVWGAPTSTTLAPSTTVTESPGDSGVTVPSESVDSNVTVVANATEVDKRIYPFGNQGYGLPFPGFQGPQGVFGNGFGFNPSFSPFQGNPFGQYGPGQNLFPQGIFGSQNQNPYYNQGPIQPATILGQPGQLPAGQSPQNQPPQNGNPQDQSFQNPFAQGQFPQNSQGQVPQNGFPQGQPQGPPNGGSFPLNPANGTNNSGSDQPALPPPGDNGPVNADRQQEQQGGNVANPQIPGNQINNQNSGDGQSEGQGNRPFNQNQPQGPSGPFPQGPQGNGAQNGFPQGAQGNLPQGGQGGFPQGGQGGFPQGGQGGFPQGSQGGFPQGGQGGFPQGGQGGFPQGGQGGFPQGGQGGFPQNGLPQQPQNGFPQAQFPNNQGGQQNPANAGPNPTDFRPQSSGAPQDNSNTLNSNPGGSDGIPNTQSRGVTSGVINAGPNQFPADQAPQPSQGSELRSPPVSDGIAADKTTETEGTSDPVRPAFRRPEP